MHKATFPIFYLKTDGSCLAAEDHGADGIYDPRQSWAVGRGPALGQSDNEDEDGECGSLAPRMTASARS
jgi:hypothetical protein